MEEEEEEKQQQQKVCAYKWLWLLVSSVSACVLFHHSSLFSSLSPSALSLSHYRPRFFVASQCLHFVHVDLTSRSDLYVFMLK